MSLLLSAAQTGQGISVKQGGCRIKKDEEGGDGDQGKEVRVHSSQVWLIALDTDSF